ncbi:zinc-dependent metalloprotease [uncultured Sphingomonas sp.]|uniref:zinc-dependent metalloprotease n=1 Tax=uncultured Sphingomonas sp. TaxID=158754 RepID=UPI0035C9B97E
MMRISRRRCGLTLRIGTALAIVAAAIVGAQDAVAQAAAARPSADGTLLPVRVDSADGKILVTLPPVGADGTMGRFLYSATLKTGLGSAPIRLDHGMLGPTQVLAFRRLGKKVAIVFENPRYTAAGDGDAQRGVRESFPYSVIAIVDTVSVDPSGDTTINIAPLLTHDTMNIAGALNGAVKGFRLVESLSAADPGAVKVFPDNIEMEAVQTYASETPGKEVDTIAPDGRQVSFTVHHSFVRLPAPGFLPRRFDIRSGTHATQVYDFGTPLGDDVMRQYANHFRLDKIDPGTAGSHVRKPIVFYIDNSAPEPIRSALAEGVAWWNQAFDAAGYIDAFQVKILEPGMDPQDVRYNIVNWTERQTRSWSYGGGVIDPRTGEIVKGNVVLEGLRLRQDIILFEGLVGTAGDNTGTANDPIRVSLARIRQLGAHEVGHAIGFVHNFAGSTQGRTSVMDYPFARMTLTDGRIDLSDAYATGIGPWDKFTVDWLYGRPPPGIDPDADAARKAAAVEAAGLHYLTDIDGRNPDLGVPGDNMWTDGTDEAPDLARVMAVRRVALANFGPGVLRAGEPLSDLRRKFAPVWLLHRYEVAAVGKLIGGIDYRYAIVGGASPTPTPVAAARQRAALDGLIDTLSAKALTIPTAVSLQLSSGVNGREDPQFDTEVFDTAGASVFDPLVAADVAAQVTLDTLLAPSRLARVYLQHSQDTALPGLDEILDALSKAVIDTRCTAVERRVAHRTILEMARTRRDPTTSIDVAAVLSGRLGALATRFAAAKGDGEDAAWCRGTADLLRDDATLEREIGKSGRSTPTIPPGMPI